MAATGGARWFDRRRPEKSWPSIVVSIGATAALFISAFVAMRSVRQWTGRASETLEPPVVVWLTPPPPSIERPRRTEPPATPATGAVRAPIAVPPVVAPPLASEPPMTAAPPTVARDTAPAGGKPGPQIPLGAVPRELGRTPLSGGGGNVVGVPSGVTIGSRTPNTAAYRDSVLKLRLGGIPGLARDRQPTGQEKAALELSQRVARMVARRATTAGNPNVHVPMGEGVDGVGAVGGGLAKVQGGGAAANDVSVGSSVSLPLFSSGPSAAQRRANAAIEADYQARLRRLEDRILLKRDSIRLDSLRRDSIARRRP